MYLGAYVSLGGLSRLGVSHVKVRRHLLVRLHVRRRSIYTLKRGSNKTLDYGDKRVIKARNKIIVFKRKRVRLA